MSFNRVFRIVVALLVLLVGVNITNAQKLTEEKLDAMAAKYALQSFPMLKDLLSIPNDAIYPEDIEKNIKWCEKAFGDRDFTTTRIETSTV
ncbi:MAG: hypothetical protein RIB63_17050, partial [Fulvivirga sp.]